jgi:FlaA1/EpsC-like NDP-sugar epimerase
VLRSLAGRRVVIHGTGQHTLQLEHVIRGSPARIVAFADDDRQKHGTELWGLRVIDPREAATTGATDAVISSWMHEEAIWARRQAYVTGRVLLHRVYTTQGCE